MSRSTLYIVGALLLGIGALLFVGRMRTTVTGVPAPVVTTTPSVETVEPVTPQPNTVVTPIPVNPPTTPPPVTNGITPVPPDPEAVAKIVALEKEYLAAKTQDARMDVVLNLGEIESSETVKSLARLFGLE